MKVKAVSLQHAFTTGLLPIFYQRGVNLSRAFIGVDKATIDVIEVEVLQQRTESLHQSDDAWEPFRGFCAFTC